MSRGLNRPYSTQGSSGVGGISSNIANRARELARNAQMLLSALKKQMDNDPEVQIQVQCYLQLLPCSILHTTLPIKIIIFISIGNSKAGRDRVYSPPGVNFLWGDEQK